MNQERHEFDPEQFPPEFTAAVDLLRRTGMVSIQLRFQDELEPTVWIIIAEHERNGAPFYTTACGLHPVSAMFRLAEELIDGGECMVCHKVTTFVPPDTDPLDPLFRDPLCFIEFDGEAEAYVRRH